MSSARALSLQALLDQIPNIVDHLYNQPLTLLGTFPDLPPEFTNWRDEQHAWRESVALFDQSYHMTNLYLSGPDISVALTLCSCSSILGSTLFEISARGKPSSWSLVVLRVL